MRGGGGKGVYRAVALHFFCSVETGKVWLQRAVQQAACHTHGRRLRVVRMQKTWPHVKKPAVKEQRAMAKTNQVSALQNTNNQDP